MCWSRFGKDEVNRITAYKFGGFNAEKENY
jgi:hypothetical protein